MTLIEQLGKRDRFLTTTEVMKLLKLRRNTLCAWIRAGRITAVRTGQKLFVRLPNKGMTERWGHFGEKTKKCLQGDPLASLVRFVVSVVSQLANAI